MSALYQLNPFTASNSFFPLDISNLFLKFAITNLAVFINFLSFFFNTTRSSIASLNTSSLKLILLKNLTNFTIPITGTNSFDNAQVTSGGIPLTEVNVETMESKLIKNLYFAGEILDVDGKCGGYNLGFAWLTGLIIGKSIGDNNVKNS